MKKIFIFSAGFALYFVCVSTCFAQTAQQIMRTNLERDDGRTMMLKVKISSCRTVRKGKTIKCAEKPRTKLLEEVRKDYGAQGKDTKQVMIIRKPASEKGIGFLQFDYGKEGQENDQWMYFSALGKVKRIVPGNEDRPKTGSFFGTELNYEDIEKRSLMNYTYRLLREEAFQDRQCNVIESVSTAEHLRKSNYSKIWDWIDQESNIRLKTVLFDRQGKAIKQITRTGIEIIDGIWTWRKQYVNNLKTRRISIFEVIELAYNFSVNDEYMTQRALTDASFREMHLSNYRKFLN